MPNQQGEREGSTQAPAPNSIIEPLGGEVARTGQVRADKIGDAAEQAHDLTLHRAEAARDQLHSAFLSQRDQLATRIQRFADALGSASDELLAQRRTTRCVGGAFVTGLTLTRFLNNTRPSDAPRLNEVHDALRGTGVGPMPDTADARWEEHHG